MSFAARPLLWRIGLAPLVIAVYLVAWWQNPAATPPSFLDEHAGAPTLPLSPSSPFVNSFASSDIDDYVHSAARTSMSVQRPGRKSSCWPPGSPPSKA